MKNQWLNWINLSGAKRRDRNRKQIDSGMRAIGYLGLGAGLMYLLDPECGRRRALARDRMAYSSIRERMSASEGRALM